MIDNRTNHLRLPLPHKENPLHEDLPRLCESFSLIDAEMAKLSGQTETLAETLNAQVQKGLDEALAGLADLATALDEQQAGSAPYSHLTDPAAHAGLFDEARQDLSRHMTDETAHKELFKKIAASGIPAGGILLWSGSMASVPDGWALCDGNNGTPDLRDRFVIGAGSDYAPGQSGGATTHTHIASVGATTLTVAQMPSHNHIWRFGGGSPESSTSPGFSSSGFVRTATPTFYGPTENTGGGGSHAHTASTAAASSLPPYYALCYIMKL